VPGTPDVAEVAAGLQKANARLREQNAELPAENAEPKALLAGQARKIARLERLISSNSANSSMPPSADDQPGKKPPGLGRAGAGPQAGQAARRAGGVPGAERSSGCQDPASPRRRLRVRRRPGRG
jgi:transposase